LEFWMMDPFIEDNDSSTGGDFYINIGRISEDILKDSRKSFEHGLPVSVSTEKADTTVWGKVPDNDNSSGSFKSLLQDVGLDGLSDKEECVFFSHNMSKLYRILNPDAYKEINSDPSSDDYHSYLGIDYDDLKMSILNRYKKYNNLEGNSSSERTATTIPDCEDINGDNQLNGEDIYREFKISVRPNDLIVGQYFVDAIINRTMVFPNGEPTQINWYHFKIPINSNENTIGNISSLKQFDHIRFYLTNFDRTIVLRLTEIKLKN
jgi:cell surface protein SprA